MKMALTKLKKPATAIQVSNKKLHWALGYLPILFLITAKTFPRCMWAPLCSLYYISHTTFAQLYSLTLVVIPHSLTLSLLFVAGFPSDFPEPSSFSLRNPWLFLFFFFS